MLFFFWQTIEISIAVWTITSENYLKISGSFFVLSRRSRSFILSCLGSRPTTISSEKSNCWGNFRPLNSFQRCLSLDLPVQFAPFLFRVFRRGEFRKCTSSSRSQQLSDDAHNSLLKMDDCLSRVFNYWEADSTRSTDDLELNWFTSWEKRNPAPWRSHDNFTRALTSLGTLTWDCPWSNSNFAFLEIKDNLLQRIPKKDSRVSGSPKKADRVSCSTISWMYQHVKTISAQCLFVSLHLKGQIEYGLKSSHKTSPNNEGDDLLQ
jgi:hypothetical protein